MCIIILTDNVWETMMIGDDGKGATLLHVDEIFDNSHMPHMPWQNPKYANIHIEFPTDMEPYMKLSESIHSVQKCVQKATSHTYCKSEPPYSESKTIISRII